MNKKIITATIMLFTSLYNSPVEHPSSNSTLQQRKHIPHPERLTMGQEPTTATFTQPTDRPSLVIRCLGAAEALTTMCVLCSYVCITECYQKLQNDNEYSK